MSTGTNTETRKYLYHCKKEENAPDLHGASDQLLLPDHHFKVANDGFQLVFKCQLWINLKRISAINWTLEYEKENQSHNAMWRCFKQCFKFSNREAMTEYGISVWWLHCSLYPCIFEAVQCAQQSVTKKVQKAATGHPKIEISTDKCTPTICIKEKVNFHISLSLSPTILLSASTICI